MRLKDGATLQNGKYRIIRLLGQGGFGITYLAENTFFDRRVAIKEFFPKDFCGRDNTSHLTLGTQNNVETVARLKDRFLKEAKNIAKLDHPGIVKIHDIFEENNTAYYVMDYIEGENLNEMVKRDGPLPEEKAVGYIRKIGEALEYIHSRNMTHFDVKPANVVVRRSDDKPILIDFGLSKQYTASGDATSTLMQGVSQGYSPIELYNAGSISSFSPQTDIYSLAATLYFLITGIVPPTPPEILERGLTFPPSIASRTSSIIKKAMSLSPINRPKKILFFIEQLSPKQQHYNSAYRDREETHFIQKEMSDLQQSSYPRVSNNQSETIDRTNQLMATKRVNETKEYSSFSNSGNSNLNSKNKIGRLITLCGVCLLVIIAIINKNPILERITGRPSESFIDRNELMVGDYIYDSDGFYSHNLIKGYRPTARVVSTNFGIKCISLIPIGECSYSNIEDHLNTARNNYKNPHLPTNEEMKDISEKLYDLHWTGTITSCPPQGGFASPSPKHSYSTWYGNTFNSPKEHKMENELGRKFWLSSSETINVSERKINKNFFYETITHSEVHAKYWDIGNAYKINCNNVTEEPNQKLPVIIMYDL